MSNKSQANQEPENLVRTVFMGRERIGNTLYFESDEDFERFAIRPYAEAVRTEGGTLTIECDYSDKYKQCLEQGIEFEIKDEHSEVAKRQRAWLLVPILDLDGNMLNQQKNAELNVKVNDFYADRYRKMKEKDLHNKLDTILGKSIVDEFIKNADLFESLWFMEQKVFDFMIKLKKKNETEFDVEFDVEDFLDRLQGCIKDDLELSPDIKVRIKKLAQLMYNYINE